MGWQKDNVQVADLEKAKNDSGGCEVCRMVLDGFMSYRDHVGKAIPLPSSISIKCVPGRSMIVKRGVIKPPSGSENGSTSQEQTSDDILGTQGLEFFIKPGIGRPTSRHLSDNSCTELASQWIRDCSENHLRCRQTHSTIMPSRLIDVGSDDQDPVLVESLELKAQYATLSHCWGKVRPMTTTMSTLSDRMQSIPLNLLPKTFQDTVLLTRKFRLKYLWIDSLCIIQDSKDDWEVESAKMGQIYRGSAITIAATSATDSRDGCFVEKQNWIESVPFETLDVDGLPATVYVQSVSQASHDISHNRLFEDEPLSRRGWVLQERLLSTRVLLYTASELVFECQTDLYCECGEFPFKRSFANADESLRSPTAYPASHQWKVLSLLKDTFARASIWSMTLLRDSSPSFLSILFNLALQYATNNRLLDRPKIFQYWRHIITIYTQRCLTFDRDILPALSGLASLIQPLVLDAYLAGLWREDFHRQLLWCKACSHIRLTADDHALLKSLPFEQINQTFLPYRSRRTTELCPPTWSWASVRGAVSYDGMWTSEGKLEGLAKVLAVHCDLNSRDPTGAVNGGYLTLLAPFAPVKLGFYEESPTSLLQRCHVGDFSCGQNAANHHEHNADCVEWNFEEWAVLDLPWGEEVSIEEFEFWRLQVAFKRPPHLIEMVDYAGQWLLGKLADEIARECVVCYYLLLKRVEGREGFFERVGLFVKRVRLEGEGYPQGETSKITII
ncbi:hypothetical protein ACEPPN_006699 [Leptodophora sp. 'Broadleaf-Isolate-01']